MQTRTDHPSTPFAAAILASLTAVVTCSFLMASQLYGPGIQLAGLAGLALVPFATSLLLSRRGLRQPFLYLLAVGAVALISMELFLRLEMSGGRWQALRLALAAVYSVPALSGSLGYLAGQRLGWRQAGRWGLGSLLMVLGWVQVPVSALYLVCNFGYDCL